MAVTTSKQCRTSRQYVVCSPSRQVKFVYQQQPSPYGDSHEAGVTPESAHRQVEEEYARTAGSGSTPKKGGPTDDVPELGGFRGEQQFAIVAFSGAVVMYLTCVVVVVVRCSIQYDSLAHCHAVLPSMVVERYARVSLVMLNLI